MNVNDLKKKISRRINIPSNKVDACAFNRSKITAKLGTNEWVNALPHPTTPQCQNGFCGRKIKLNTIW